ncbi:PqqD family protein [Paenibacillus sp. Soil522]|uniref:PqqD family protein n=1 Tax=Paenibacillus sp. Soil522 TaxID=1736388 RepID=UPI0006F3ECE2|nr:PqqD family protein [Paenibacillus sp. Soil522]KRE51268.1 hypothetical protein ASG81_03665 [Paenibacillus sp. Soil522]
MVAKYKQSHGVEAIEVEGEWIIVHTKNHTVTKLNETAGYIWSLLKQELTMEDLMKWLHSEHSAFESVMKNDVERCVENLQSIGLIECNEISVEKHDIIDTICIIQ